MADDLTLEGLINPGEIRFPMDVGVVVDVLDVVVVVAERNYFEIGREE